VHASASIVTGLTLVIFVLMVWKPALGANGRRCWPTISRR